MWCGTSNETKCTVIAVLNTILHTMLICYSSVILLIKAKKFSEHSSSVPLVLTKGHGYMDTQYTTLYALNGTIIGFGVLGIIMAALLFVGIKKNRHGFVLVFLCHSIVASILLMLTGILLFLNGYWRIAVAVTIMSVLGFDSSRVVYRTYEDFMKQDATFTRHNSISNVTLLSEDFNDLTDDTNQDRPSRLDSCA